MFNVGCQFNQAAENLGFSLGKQLQYLRKRMKSLNCLRLAVVLSAMIGMSSLLPGSASALGAMAVVQSPSQLTWDLLLPSSRKAFSSLSLRAIPLKLDYTLSFLNGRLALRSIRTGISPMLM
jgi:hypothetical protein